MPVAANFEVLGQRPLVGGFTEEHFTRRAGAAVGVGGIVAMGVARQRREVGICTALGARRADISRMVVGDHPRPVIIGAMLGLLASWWVMRLLSTLLYQIDPHDALIWAIASLAVIGVAALAAWVPAYRAWQRGSGHCAQGRMKSQQSQRGRPPAQNPKD